MDDYGEIIWLVIKLIAIVLVIYCVVILAGILAAIAGTGGIIWGGGTAIINYGKSFKKNMIDSNRFLT